VTTISRCDREPSRRVTDLPLKQKSSSISLTWSASATRPGGTNTWEIIVDAHRDGKRFIVRADEMLTAFVELQRGIHEFAVRLVL
jgi:hypothetical protein